MAFIIVVVIYIVFIIKRRNNLEQELLEKGVFHYAVIVREFIGRTSTRQFTYQYQVKNKSFAETLGVEVTYFNKHKIGDTIIIKFLPNDPKKSMIIENEEYDSCYGVPPTNGWKELPKCDNIKKNWK